MAKKENKTVILINPKLYSLEAVYGAAYVFLDKAYIYLEQDPRSKIKVNLKWKTKMTKKRLEVMRGEFLNELLNFSLREKISKSNRKIREYIVARALVSASQESLPEQKRKSFLEKGPSDIAVPWRNKNQEQCRTEESDKKPVWTIDTKGIAVPWEEKYLNKKPCRKEKIR